MSHPSKRRSRVRATVVLTSALLAAAPALAACGNSSSTDAEPAATRTATNGDVYNEADVTFAQQMIPHHAQAIEMTDMTRGRDLSPEVAQLAASIMEAQTPEIETMTDWLSAWGEDIPETMRDHANAHGDAVGDMEGEELPGMMSQDEWDALASAPDAEFEDMWLDMMVQHHRGAIEMAEDEQEDGMFSPAVGLAETIAAGQAAEVDQMTDLIER
ncbi:MAG TPA: DUF305 domain-containing protein [Nocardioides sp.]|nr:DUF305 domain-containing protein [Nocardioides sp.]